jgi:hypothetical protein
MDLIRVGQWLQKFKRQDRLRGMRPTTVIFVLFVFALPNSGSAQSHITRRIPCKTIANEASCFWMHGRLGFYNGTPAMRLWQVGTHRLLAVSSGPGAEKNDELDNEHPELPPNIQRAIKPFQNRIFADFEVCPLEPTQPNTMQPVCIESAKNIVVEP